MGFWGTDDWGSKFTFKELGVRNNPFFTLRIRKNDTSIVSIADLLRSFGLLWGGIQRCWIKLARNWLIGRSLNCKRMVNYDDLRREPPSNLEPRLIFLPWYQYPDTGPSRLQVTSHQCWRCPHWSISCLETFCQCCIVSLIRMLIEMTERLTIALQMRLSEPTQLLPYLTPHLRRGEDQKHEKCMPNHRQP